MHSLHFLLALSALAAPCLSASFNPLEHLAGISPYFTSQDPPLNPSPPQGCKVTRAAYLIRHAAIYANDFDYETYIEPFVEKLHNTSQNWSSTTDLQFLSNWTAPIDEEHLEKITRVGMQEAMTLGKSVKKRYSDLKTPAKIWSSTSERTVKTAQGFISGYTNNHTSRVDLKKVEEGKSTGADSLTPYKSCPAYSPSYGSDQSTTYTNHYTKPIIARLHAQAPAFNFTKTDIAAMFQLCGYETVIRGSSPFCSRDLFTQNEWLSFEYANDIMYFYNTGYGRDLSPSLGYPWINASVAALSSPSPSQHLYVSFTHRELPPTVITALGLFNNSAYTNSNNINATMPLDKVNYHRAWKSSTILPFLTNIAIERMSCNNYGYDQGDYYRLLLNEGPQPLVDCQDGPGQSCSSRRFLDFVEERGELYGDFDGECGGNGGLTDSLTIYD
ncbi:hypothetical protein ASPWEDRAFT_118605 [Aspergillus wentii DTO 134E9]|uniref:Acid phosphatase n=1 Tax=Aspergillus wentii DTO 134E9 TaxID=1073089 RepID=A0A1L9R8W5_ASPWE|nr:uncharacterized protein ASPWEDRAFT_118605 [Aspergillus wentii DTO 134E9]OJJ31365.1 hypothetical protein ASPWEDRAFT_118605 [Aspergillus wentii DTO 134E9]